MGAGEKPRLLALNKIDLLDPEERTELRLRHPDAIQVSAQTGDGLEALRARIAGAIGARLTEVELLYPSAMVRGLLSSTRSLATSSVKIGRTAFSSRSPSGSLVERFGDLAVNVGGPGGAGVDGHD